jgi:hypothetical protein
MHPIPTAARHTTNLPPVSFSPRVFPLAESVPIPTVPIQYSRKFQRAAVERMKTCESVDELARELGVRGSTPTQQRSGGKTSTNTSKN